MLGKVFLFSFLLYITRSPILALLILLVILYVIDRRFIGLSPSLIRPIKRMRRISRLKQELRANPHHASSKLDLARSLMESGKYRDALSYLREVEPVMEESADVAYEIGLCLLKLGELDEGKLYMDKALQLNPRVRFGDPYLQLGEAFTHKDPHKAVEWLERFRQEQSSSVEAYYRLGLLYKKLNREPEAKVAFRESLEVYRSLPKYSRRKQRRWAILARFK
ncbi:tetratricopeptide repeat protein [Paenibacillus lutrae]|uniref:Tetratricopeptide repeat protein n=1 Tax=Paenibacillus lutrae TaxID=2078573 RepID=A0A7X3JXV3_9BACL|nr:tetratricopeptide repeat protein [Paenibacillus lutrae]MVO98448.1 tetratricopeptide repeat protein [Paenibacillus lutrae]